MLFGGERSPNGKWIAFISSGQGVHHAYLFDAENGRLVGDTQVPVTWAGLDWSADSKTLYISGGTTPRILKLGVSDAGEMTVGDPLKITLEGTEQQWFAGLVVLDKSAYLAASATDRLLEINLETGEVQRELKFELASAPFSVKRGGEGKLLVSLQGGGKVQEVSTESLTVTRSWNTGRHPNDILVKGDRLFVACGNDDEVDVIDLYNGGLEERIVTRPWPHAPAGSTPDALAVTADGKTLLVANADNNAVAVIDIAKRGASEIEGFIPSGAYPCALAVLNDQKTVLIGAGKGVQTGPNGNTKEIDKVAPKGYPYIVTLMNGLVTKVDFAKKDQLQEMTKDVLALASFKPGIENKPLNAPSPGVSAIPSRLGEPSPIKHVLYIIKENRTYDQVFGDLTKDGKPYGNGDPNLTLFGEDVAPNHRELARKYVLLDNLYASGEVSVDGHHWSNGAYVPDFMQRTWPQQYSGKGTPRLAPTLSDTPNGRIWDQCRRAGLDYATYYYHTKDRTNAAWNRARTQGVRDYLAVDIFLKDFEKFESTGKVPNFMVMALSEDHTRGTAAGAFTPKAAVASNDLGIGKIVERISKSKYWKEFAIFIIEDDAQNGPDHVDAHRTVCLAVSPYTYNAGVDSTFYSTMSVLRSMELILGLRPMSQFDASASPLFKAFSQKPNTEPYKALTPKQDMLAKNPPKKSEPLLDSIDFREPDQMTLAQEIALNKAIWKSIKGNQPYPGAVRRFGSKGSEPDDD
jgi:sugar lactone lactonase YvrE